MTLVKPGMTIVFPLLISAIFYGIASVKNTAPEHLQPQSTYALGLIWGYRCALWLEMFGGCVFYRGNTIENSTYIEN
jgi:hypothetical protein